MQLRPADRAEPRSETEAGARWEERATREQPRVPGAARTAAATPTLLREPAARAVRPAPPTRAARTTTIPARCRRRRVLSLAGQRSMAWVKAARREEGTPSRRGHAPKRAS